MGGFSLIKDDCPRKMAVIRTTNAGKSCLRGSIMLK